MAESETNRLDDKELASCPTATSRLAATHEPQWKDNVFPPEHGNRTLIVCFDGTGDKFDADVSHISLRPRASSTADDGPLEFERRAIYLHAEKG